MTDLALFWTGLPADLQDALIALGLLCPGLLAGIIVLHGLAPWPLIRAMLGRFGLANVVFVGLIAVAVGIGVGLTAQERGLRQGSARAAEKFDLVVGTPGSEITLMLATVYLQPSDVPLITGPQFAEIAATDRVVMAAPIAFGDSHNGAPVIGTTAEFVTHLSGGLAAGRIFQTADEAVAGAYAPLGIGAAFTPAHGHGPATETDAHQGFAYTVTGRMPPTGSPWDRALIVPVEGVWAVHGLADGHAPENAGRIGAPFDPDYFPGTPAVLVRAEALWANYALKSRFTRPDMMAFFPGTVLAQLHAIMGDVRAAMSLLAVVTQVLVTVAVLAGLMILMRIFARGLALLRAVGAPVRYVFAVVWGYSALLIVAGALAGMGVGMIAAALLSRIVTARTDVLVSASLGWPELHLVAGFVSLTLLLALLPAWLAVCRPLIPDLRA